MDRFDVAVIGAGFGGLGAALHLVESGARVVVFEALNYPGGCASTFTRGGHSYESGATMFAGLAPGQWMRSWVDRHEMDVEIQLLDPVIDFRSDRHSLTVPADRDAWCAQLMALPGAPRGLRGFFDEQARTADVLWKTFGDPTLLPPLSWGMLGHHLKQVPAYVPLVRQVGRPLLSVLERHGVAEFEPLRTWLDAVCQITVQTDVTQAEAPITLAAVDYFFRGVAHVKGGVGSLATSTIGALERAGATVRMPDRVNSIRRERGGFLVESRRGTVHADQVVLNQVPQTAADLLGRDAGGRMADRVATSWGATMLYQRVRAPSMGPGAHHVQCVLDSNATMVDGNLVLVSTGEADADGERSRSVSTHIRMDGTLPSVAAVEACQRQMRETVALRLPEVEVVSELPASPRTFQRFTRRENGFVGGIPRRSGWRNYQQLWPLELEPGAWLVGDSVFPGQSVLSVALGGHRTAEAVLRML